MSREKILKTKSNKITEMYHKKKYMYIGCKLTIIEKIVDKKITSLLEVLIESFCLMISYLKLCQRAYPYKMAKPGGNYFI